MLRRYWRPVILLWLAASSVVLTLTYYPLILSFIDFRLVVAVVMITCAAAAIWGAFQWIEVKSERVSDPDVLSDRMQSQVYTLPRLPAPSQSRENDPVGFDRLVQRFIDRLDHIWFEIRANRVGRGKGQCLLLTSAVHGEGKSTLAAQLAVRCGNAGTSSLLIDADLRTSTLNHVLDIPAGPGLSDVLAGKADLHDALVPAHEGRFHFLQAGEPVRDSLQCLNDPNFGMVIAQCRERFDLTIIDCAPVVPLPESLALCEWVDGVLVTSRYDFSRYPDMEWARRKLAATGVPIIAVALSAYPFDDPPA